MTPRITFTSTVDLLILQSAGAVALTVAAVWGSIWSLAVLALWLPVYFFGIARAGVRAVRSGRGVLRATMPLAMAVSLPFLVALAALASSVFDPELRRPVLVALGMGAVAGWLLILAVLWLARSRMYKKSEPPTPVKQRILLSTFLTLAMFSVPFAAFVSSNNALAAKVSRCVEMRSYVARGASQQALRVLAQACGQRDGDVKATEAVGGIRIEAYPGDRNADFRTVAADAKSFIATVSAVLGTPPTKRITVSPVAIPGPTRGQAGPGYLLIDSAELESPQACDEFRSSAGTKGTCGTWVVAHELGHQWFPGLAELGPPINEVAWEATADYLAWDWWRQEFGGEDADRLRSELFEGRVLLADLFAATHAPGDPPRGMNDYEHRALIRGRGPLGLIAAEQTAGREALMAVLERAFAKTGRGSMTIRTILGTAEEVSPEVAAVLQQWWMDPSSNPRLPSQASFHEMP